MTKSETGEVLTLELLERAIEEMNKPPKKVVYLARPSEVEFCKAHGIPFVIDEPVYFK